MVAVGQHSPDY